MRTERAEPILPSRDLAETRRFYERLGFDAWFGDRAPWAYEILSRGHLVVHFYADSALDPLHNPTSCYWRVKDADRLYSEFAAYGLPAEGIPRLTRPHNAPWGMREFTLVDPSGNLVRIGHDLDAAAAYVPSGTPA